MSVTKKMIQQLQKEIHDTPQYKESIAFAKIALLDYLACYSAGLQSAKGKVCCKHHSKKLAVI